MLTRGRNRRSVNWSEKPHVPGEGRGCRNEVSMCPDEKDELEEEEDEV